MNQSNVSALIRIVKQLTYVLTPKQKKQSVIVFISMLAMSCLELLGVSALYPLLQLVVDVDAVKSKWYVNWIYILNPSIGNQAVVLLFCVLIICVYIFKNVFAIYFTYIQYRFATTYQKEASTMMLQKYMERPYEYFVNTNSSIITRGVYHDTAAVYSILTSIFQASSELLTVFMLGIFLMSMDLFMAICSLALAVLCFMIIVFVFKGRIKKAGKTAREASAVQDQWLRQAIHGIKEVLVLDRKDLFLKNYEEAAEISAKCQLTQNTISSCPDRIIEGICVSGFVGIVCFRMMLGGDLTSFVPIIGAFAMGAFRILPSIAKLTNRVNTLVYYQMGLQSCYDNIKEANEYEKEAHQKAVDANKHLKNNLEAERHEFKKDILIDGISWKYQNAEKKVISDLNMTILRGESVAFIGPSGAGKTTLADIVMGLLKPQSGEIKVDGINIDTIPHQWHRMVGYVPQVVYLIDDTIRANVAFGIAKDRISDDKIWDALVQAHLDEFVKNLPNGLDTIVGERGVKFSGGQRQRIALARALYENPDILVLDEATSALDNETEKAVMESIEALQGHKTLVIVAHRLTTIRNCDTIYEIRDGKAVKKEKSELFSE